VSAAGVYRSLTSSIADRNKLRFHHRLTPDDSAASPVNKSCPFRLVLLLSARAKPISVKWNSGRAVHRQEPFITTINIHHISQTSIVSGTVSGTGFYLFRTDTVSSGRISSLPDGFCLYRADAGHPRRFRCIYIAMQFPSSR